MHKNNFYYLTLITENAKKTQETVNLNNVLFTFQLQDNISNIYKTAFENPYITDYDTSAKYPLIILAGFITSMYI